MICLAIQSTEILKAVQRGPACYPVEDLCFHKDKKPEQDFPAVLFLNRLCIAHIEIRFEQVLAPSQ